MDESIKTAIYKAVSNEPFSQLLQMKLIELEEGYSKVEMALVSNQMNNIYQRAHGGAIFALIDEAFETAAQTDGTIAVALNINISYMTSPEPNATLYACAQEIHRTKKTAHFEIKVMDQVQNLIASCQALAYRTGKPIPFL